MLASLHNRNRTWRGLKNPATGGFFDAVARASADVVNKRD
jgi:hypothetical protein